MAAGAGREFKPAQKQKDASAGGCGWCSGDGSHHHHQQQQQQDRQRRDQQTTDDDDWQSFPNLISSYSRVCVELTNGTNGPEIGVGCRTQDAGQTSIARQSRRRPPFSTSKKYPSGVALQSLCRPCPGLGLGLGDCGIEIREELEQDSVILMKIGKCRVLLVLALAPSSCSSYAPLTGTLILRCLSGHFMLIGAFLSLWFFCFYKQLGLKSFDLGIKKIFW